MGEQRERAPYGGEVQVSPWDAILTEVRRSAYRAAWVDERVEDAAREIEAVEAEQETFDPADYGRLRLKLSAELRAWLDQSRAERSHTASVAASAVRVGLSERYIESVQAEARMIASVLTRALDAAELSASQREAAHAELRSALAEVGRELRGRHEAIGGAIPTRPEIGR